MKALITGGAGFIGFHLAKNLAEEKNEVHILDNFARAKHDEDLKLLLENKNVSLIKADVTNPDFTKELDKNYDQIYHLAAINGTGNFYKIPHLVLKVGVLGTINILDWFSQHKNGKLLISSSSEAYSGALNVMQEKFPIPTPEDVPLIIDDPKNARWSYGGSKILSEIAMHSYAHAFDIRNFVIIRYHNVYGPRMGNEHVIPQFLIRSIKKENPFKIYGGEETRTFCYIDDAIKATKIIMKNNSTNGKTIHVGGSNHEIKIIDVAKLVFEISDYNPKIEILRAPEGSVIRRCPDISKLKSLNYIPEVDLKEGIERTYEWYRKN